ncbi:MAG: hypothetical protein IJ154_04840 [Bacteroidales bacterium]|nr:hypothetical protein [Bacteroidales bacterium]
MSRFTCHSKTACLLGYLLMCVLPLWSAPKERPKTERDTVLYHGSYLGTDFVQDALTVMGKNGSINLTADINLRNKYLPSLEVGYAPFSMTADNGIEAGGQGYFGKIGVNLPISYFGPDAENMFFAGLHYGLGFYDYHLQNVPFQAGYWNTAYTSHFMEEHSNAHWLEVTGGMRMQISGPLFLGWTVRWKRVLKTDEGEHGTAPFIPGFGKNQTSNFTFGFCLYYRLPW